MDKAYDHKKVEDKWYQFWEEKGFFKADSSSDKPSYCIVLPPPNVTGKLHMGHALVDTLQDILIRWKRMSGFETLWIPGVDHAGISTQTVVERHLMASENKRRTDYPREEFLKHVWKWKEDHESQIISQLKKLGCSCDWSRKRFTMDEEASRAVRVMFKKLYDAGLIYQGDYLVNWDPVTQTALADDEVEYEEKDSHLWHLRYPIEGEESVLIIATTRPETMLGDTGIAVSPNDERYQHLIGKKVRLPIMNRLIPIFADRHVDPEFGTGVVKVTPAHDPNDYEMGLTHDLPMINIMTPDGKINENGGEFHGMTMLEARVAVVDKMKELDLLERIEPHKHRVGLSYRSKAIIEPYLSKQWFVKMSAFKEDLMRLVKEDQVKLVPKNWENTYFHWIDNLRDWCISRQLWWGHRIPIWYHKDDPNKIICQVDDENLSDEWVQDEDVLDTWFSSALWPFSTLGWPDNTPDLKRFYPNATLITGHDILFFWVARMIFMGNYAMETPPFPETFLHGLIYGKSYWRVREGGHIAYVSPDEKKAYDLGESLPKDVQAKWEKMSKSKGNVIDPLEIIDSYGTDAMRMALAASATYARQIDLDLRRFEEYKNFINKIWNGARFVFMNLENLSFSNGLDTTLLTLEDKWIFSLLNRTIDEVTTHLSKYEFDHAAKKSYDFFWNQFCAYYVEMAKPILFGKIGDDALKENKQKMLVIILTATIRLMHPMAPFITEELFMLLKGHFPNLTNNASDPYSKDTFAALLSQSCMVAPFPTCLAKEDINPDIENQFSFIREVVYALRNIRAEMQLPPGMATNLYLSGDKVDIIQKSEGILRSLIKLEKIYYQEESKAQFSSTTLVGKLKLDIPLPEAMLEKEITRLKKEKEKLEKQITSLENQLQNKNFVERAPEELVQKVRTSLTDAQEKLKEILTRVQ